jgi:hypothetical protein
MTMRLAYPFRRHNLQPAPRLGDKVRIPLLDLNVAPSLRPVEHELRACDCECADGWPNGSSCGAHLEPGCGIAWSLVAGWCYDGTLYREAAVGNAVPEGPVEMQTRPDFCCNSEHPSRAVPCGIGGGGTSNFQYCDICRAERK